MKTSLPKVRLLPSVTTGDEFGRSLPVSFLHCWRMEAASEAHQFLTRLDLIGALLLPVVMKLQAVRDI